MITIFTDGGSRNNPGIAGIGAVIYDGTNKIAEISEFIGIQTNNFAEYTAVIKSLEWLISNNRNNEFILKSDSKLMVEQVNGNWKVKEPTLKILLNNINKLLLSFNKYKFTHIMREENKEADKLANMAMDRAV